MSLKDFRLGALLFLGYFTLALIGLSIDPVNEYASLFWPPSGLAIAALIIYGRRFWPAVFLGAFAANYYHGGALLAALGIGTGNAFASVVGAYLCTSSKKFSASLSRFQDVLALFFKAAFLSTLVSSTVGVFALAGLDIVEKSELTRTWLTWWMGDALGILTFGSLLLVYSTRQSVTEAIWGKRSLSEAMILTTLFLAAIGFGFFGLPDRYSPLALLVLFPLILWAALRFGQKGSVLVSFAVSTAAVWGTAVGRGPFIFENYAENMLFLVSYVIVFTMIGLVVSAVVIERENAREKLRQSAESASAAKTFFLANMSHEIRTPLGAVLGFSELIANDKLSKVDKLEAVAAIKRNGQLLSNIINDILDLSKVEAGKLEVERVEVNFEEVVKDISAVLSLKASEKGIKLKMVTEDVIPVRIETDPLRLRQIILNIVGNAIKFTSEGSVEVKVRLLKRHTQNPKLAFYVKDTGRGIPPEQIPRLFTPFTQADASTTRKYGGTGLGLVLSKRLAQALGGDVEMLASRPGVGSTFLITVDAGNSEKVLFKNFETEESVKNLIPETEKNEIPMKILVVDDSLDNQVLITHHLEMAGADVVTANNGKEGVEKAQRGAFDLVLMDLQMPEMDGFEATKLLRDHGYDKPIIALTAHAMKDDRRRCLANGFNDHLSKPIDRDSLLKALSRFAV